MSDAKCHRPPQLMGILNVTPDSFSDGGRFDVVDTAVARGLEMATQGAVIIDVGGESTRPGSERISIDQQVQRVVEPIRQLRAALDQSGAKQVAISIDTTRSEVARAALDVGAQMLNDISAGLEDPQMLTLAAQRRVPIVLMHMRGEPGTMQNAPQYDDVVGEVLAFLLGRVDAAVAAGVQSGQVWIDPGIGFGKTLEHNLQLLGRLDRFVATGHPVLLGASRKSFIAAAIGADLADCPPDARLAGSLAAALLGAQAEVHAIRVHNVAEHRQALDVMNSIQLNTSQTKDI